MTRMMRTLNFLMISVLPLLSGCNEGGSGAGSVGSLFGASSDVLTLGSGPTGAPGPGGGSDLASIHQPEPTTMLLVGGGMMAIAYFRNRQN